MKNTYKPFAIISLYELCILLFFMLTASAMLFGQNKNTLSLNPDGLAVYASDMVMAINGFEIYTGKHHASTIQSGLDIDKISADPVNRKLYLYNTLSLHNNEIFITSLDDPLNNTIKPEDNERGIFEKRALRATAF